MPPPARCHFRQSELLAGYLAVGATEFTSARFYENEAHGLVALWAGRWRGVLGHVTLTLDQGREQVIAPRGKFCYSGLGQNHSLEIFLSRINTERDRSRPAPLNSATVTNVSMLAIVGADARGRNLAIAAVMSISKFFGAGRPLFCRWSMRPVRLPRVNI
jgi:hypothetical protein